MRRKLSHLGLTVAAIAMACFQGVDTICAEANVQRVEILILESFPVQVNVRAMGYLPDSCTTIGDISQSRDGDTFMVMITTSRPADAVCAQVLVSFEEVIPLDVAGLPAGTYTVDVNGVTDTFTLTVDNVARGNTT